MANIMFNIGKEKITQQPKGLESNTKSEKDKEDQSMTRRETD